MSTHTLKDEHCRIIGYIDTRLDGSQVGKNAHYHIGGDYDPTADTSKDAH